MSRDRDRLTRVSQETWVDLQLRRARERGDFDDLPGYGKPIADLTDHHDPEWWVKRLVEREQIRLLPPALQIRAEDAALADTLDRLPDEAAVRREVTQFNDRVRAALYRTWDGPPVVTAQRDVDSEIAAWRARRAARTARQAHAAAPTPSRRRWWRRGLRRGTPGGGGLST